MNEKARLILYIVALSIVDILIPVPILGIVLIYIVLQRPAWARAMFRSVYGNGDRGGD